ncbi:hypothetical protein ALI22I_19405 [Saccharothrix sp. ALI-22-I]|uniref:PRC-barrel domain-containing protein n=1 Tax=Saccharothrix sp. ALI-22-I TaxID=1933778 RepID=UPI00097CA333|nr:PRC-barrel domain-containing protein [Saccharothrix sp. ALI-22-I]ONI88513.1 hypothetical protein ALI22I_19405 [Saccharothrix sp. ALI-22-I]
MINEADVDLLYDCEVVDEHNKHIGSVKQVWLDEQNGRPIWASVRTGRLFGHRESFVPIQDATMANGVIMVPVDRHRVKDAPRIDVSEQYLSKKQQDELYEYYGMTPSRRGGGPDQPADGDRADTRPMPTATPERHGRHEAAPDESVTQYLEDLDVSASDVEFGRVRLVKHVVTEREDPSAPVTHEEVRVVLEPVEDEAEVTVPDQQPVVEEPVAIEPLVTEQVDVQPADVQPADTEPADTELGIELLDTEPADTEPADTELADTELGMEPVDTEPGTKPVDTEPGMEPVEPVDVERDDRTRRRDS